MAKNVRQVARLDIAGGGQVYVEGNTCYVGHMKPAHGTTIIDVSDPKKPKILGEKPSARSTVPRARPHRTGCGSC